MKRNRIKQKYFVENSQKLISVQTMRSAFRFSSAVLSFIVFSLRFHFTRLHEWMNFMEAKSLLLANGFVIILISFSTEHWVKTSYFVKYLPEFCDLHKFEYFSILQCGKEKRLLTPQYSNLFKQCNDLTSNAFLI